MNQGDRLRELLQERETGPARSDLERVLVDLSARTGREFRLLVPPFAGTGPDVLTARYERSRSAGSVERRGPSDLLTALTRLSSRLPGRGSGSWLVVPGRREKVGAVWTQGHPDLETLAALAEWDGEGLLLGPVVGDWWGLVDIDGVGDDREVELLTPSTGTSS